MSTDAVELTGRQRDVLAALDEGLTLPEVGARLGIAPRTAKQHADALRRKLGAETARRLPARARELGILR